MTRQILINSIFRQTTITVYGGMCVTEQDTQDSQDSQDSRDSQDSMEEEPSDGEESDELA